MPPFEWPIEPTKILQGFEECHNETHAGALFGGARVCVENLHYLADLDIDLDRAQSEERFAGHNLFFADVAHARWATSTCITALDLCAAGLGCAFCDNKNTNEFSLRYFDTSEGKKRAFKYRSKLTSACCHWIDGVLADQQFLEIKAARNELIHSLPNQHFHSRVGAPRQRLKLTVNNHNLSVRDLIEHARDLATRQVVDFFKLLPHL